MCNRLLRKQTKGLANNMKFRMSFLLFKLKSSVGSQCRPACKQYINLEEN